MHNHCFVCFQRINWYCGKYGVEIPLFQKPTQCTVKINPGILEEKLKRNQVTTFETYIKKQMRMKND